MDAKDVVHRVITKHFLPDLIGNLKCFSGQKFRCTKCGESYRRMPLCGHCYCGNKLNLTVHEASVKKYLEVTSRIGRDYGVSEYTQQRIRLIEKSITSIFGEKVDRERRHPWTPMTRVGRNARTLSFPPS